MATIQKYKRVPKTASVSDLLIKYRASMNELSLVVDFLGKGPAEAIGLNAELKTSFLNAVEEIANNLCELYKAFEINDLKFKARKEPLKRWTAKGIEELSTRLETLYNDSQEFLEADPQSVLDNLNVANQDMCDLFSAMLAKGLKVNEEEEEEDDEESDEEESDDEIDTEYEGDDE